jgi:hypothetical protein
VRSKQYWKEEKVEKRRELESVDRTECGGGKRWKRWRNVKRIRVDLLPGSEIRRRRKRR